MYCKITAVFLFYCLKLISTYLLTSKQCTHTFKNKKANNYVGQNKALKCLANYVSLWVADTETNYFCKTTANSVTICSILPSSKLTSLVSTNMHRAKRYSMNQREFVYSRLVYRWHSISKMAVFEPTTSRKQFLPEKNQIWKHC